MANLTLTTRAMLHRAQSATHLTIVELQIFFTRMVVDSPHLGRADQYQDED
jgi:hypothetical protein